jgi:SAM-dependent methyltransferase
MDKNIDFDQVAELYDVYVQTDFDIPFWIEEARQAGGDILELMCGTGRIGIPLIDAGMFYTGVDYSEGLLSRFREKLHQTERIAYLICDDARRFELDRRFDLVFIGFHSLSEVLEDEDKLKVIRQAGRHLKPDGRFEFSLQNPAVRAPHLNAQLSAPQQFELGDGKYLEFRYQLQPPQANGRVAGWQFYSLRDQYGSTLDRRQMEICFHLIGKQEIERLISQAGFRVDALWGDYDRSPYTDSSPYMIYRCVR